jgi:NhaP-type Na+/H+ and K+/H+ antiporter
VSVAHQLILLAGALGLLSIFVGLASARFGAPLLLVFLVLGMLAGEDGPGGIVYDDFWASYLIGSVALVVILFEGGLKTKREMIRLAFAPALVLATVGVALNAGIVAAAAIWFFDADWRDALLVGAAVAPTDAAAVSTLLRRAGIALPERVVGVLEMESGLNDPMSVFLTVVLVESLLSPGSMTGAHAATLFLAEMGGGCAIGVAAGYGMLALMRRLSAEAPLFPVLAFAGALATFGAAQSLETSGFLAVYVMAVIVGINDHQASREVEHFFETFGWLAQIVLFLMLGLLVNPHELVPLLFPALVLAGILIVIARPAGTFACLLPFRFSAREAGFVSWVGLRGGVPIYLTIIPLLAGVKNANLLFCAVFVIVIASLVIQGWTIAPAAKLMGFGKKPGT